MTLLCISLKSESWTLEGGGGVGDFEKKFPASAGRKKKIACSTNVIESLWEKRENNILPTILLEKKILDDQKSPTPLPHSRVKWSAPYDRLSWLAVLRFLELWERRDMSINLTVKPGQAYLPRSLKWIYYSKVEYVDSCRFQIHLCACMRNEPWISSVSLNLMWRSSKKYDLFKDFQSDLMHLSM